MAAVLVDTDVFIDHLRGARAFRRRQDVVHYSAVTLCELFAGHATEEAVIARLLRPFRPMPVTPRIAMRAGRILRRATIGTADALIAATAIEHELTLCTRNLSDFAVVKDLHIRSPR